MAGKGKVTSKSNIVAVGFEIELSEELIKLMETYCPTMKLEYLPKVIQSRLYYSENFSHAMSEDDVWTNEEMIQWLRKN